MITVGKYSNILSIKKAYDNINNIILENKFQREIQ